MIKITLGLSEKANRGIENKTHKRNLVQGMSMIFLKGNPSLKC